MHEIIKIIAKYFIVLSVVIAIVLLVRVRTKKERLQFLALLILGGVLSLVIAKLGSHLINDPRPFAVGKFTPLIPHAADNGFPSDHTLLGAFIGWAVLAYSRKLGIIALLVAALIGGSRMAAGVHHLEDIVGSFIISGLATLLARQIIKLAIKHSKRPTTNPVR